MSGSIFLSIQEYNNLKSIDKGRPYKIICIGESTIAFAGDFGHCTPLGNKLLAESISNIILTNL